MSKPSKSPSIAYAMIPVVFLILALSLNVYVFGDNAMNGSNQFIILSAAVIGVIVAFLHDVKWEAIKEGIAHNIGVAAIPIFILLMVGALSGTWLASGIIPLMVIYGLKFLTPDFFLPCSCLICAIISLVTGSSWTTAATIGIALMGVGNALDLNPGMVAGAIISGAYFGDKMSPLSDTTNLAAAATNTELFTHIRYMSLTTTPSIIIALILFTVMGLASSNEISQISNNTEIITALQNSFDLDPLLLLVPIAVIIMVIKRVPALPAIFIGMFLGAIAALILQPGIIKQIGMQSFNEQQGIVYYAGFMQMIFGDISIVTGNGRIDELLVSGGMAGMLNTIWLIMSAMVFGGVMEASGLLECIANKIIKLARSARALVAATVGTCLFTNIVASDQYLAVVLPGRMFTENYKKQGLAQKNLSRTLEDSGTVTSVLIPWNTCGAFHAGVLGVATLSYLPYCFFNLISPVMTLLFAFFCIKIARLTSGNHSQLDL